MAIRILICLSRSKRGAAFACARCWEQSQKQQILSRGHDTRPLTCSKMATHKWCAFVLVYARHRCQTRTSRDIEMGERERDPQTCEFAADSGHLDVLTCARENGCSWTAETCHAAAAFGHLQVLKWARANGCDWNAETCSRAASGGHLEVLMWARANGCPWTSIVCYHAAVYNHLEVLKWARANGCEWHPHTYSASHEEVRKWALSNGCPKD